MTQQTMGGFLAALRRECGMTQRQLAEQLRVSDKTVSRWERGETAPDLSLIPVLAELFGVTCDELLRGGRAAPADAKPPETVLAPETAPAPETPASGTRQLQHILSAAQTTHRIRSLLSVAIALIGCAAGLGCALGLSHGVDAGVLGAAVGIVAALIALTHQLVATLNAFAAIRREALEGLPLAPGQLGALERTLFRTAAWSTALILELPVLLTTCIFLWFDPVEVAILAPIWCAVTALGCWILAGVIRSQMRRKGYFA